MSENMREMTFEEEAVLYEREARELFAKEKPGYEPPPINCTVRRGMRIIRKARDEIQWLSKRGLWISVEERLPQETGDVCKVVNLLMDNGLVTAGWLNDITGLGYFLDSRSCFIRQAPISRFTHWMPLPEHQEAEV